MFIVTQKLLILEQNLIQWSENSKLHNSDSSYKAAQKELLQVQKALQKDPFNGDLINLEKIKSEEYKRLAKAE